MTIAWCVCLKPEVRTHNSKAQPYKDQRSSYHQIKDFGLGSKYCACLMCTTFLNYIWMHTGVHVVVSLEWGIHDLCILTWICFCAHFFMYTLLGINMYCTQLFFVYTLITHPLLTGSDFFKAIALMNMTSELANYCIFGANYFG